MSELRSGLDELAGEDLRFLSDAQVEARLREIARAEGILAGEKARAVAEVDRRGSFAATGHLSITSWVEDRLQTTWSEAARIVRTARALEHMPAARHSLYAGEGSSSAVGQPAGGPGCEPRAFPPAGGVLEGGAANPPPA